MLGRRLGRRLGRARMGRRWHVVIAALGLVLAAPSSAHAVPSASVEIGRHARPTSDGGIVFLVRVSCGPLPGTIDFTEGFAGARQLRTGAEGEGGLSLDVVCDGVPRTHLAAISSFTESEFRRGPALANAAVNACATVGSGQVCVSASDVRRVVIRGPALP